MRQVWVERTGDVKRRRLFVRWLDLLVALGLFVVMVSALIRWPDKVIADIAIPTAALILLVMWRER